MSIKMSREWAMPSRDTFCIPPIKAFVERYLIGAKVSVDPFARNSNLATYTNDMDTATSAEFHMDAVDFMNMLRHDGVLADVVILDPPYSNRQIKECYENFGRKYTQHDSQNPWTDFYNAADGIVPVGGVVLSFGWKSSGMGKKRGYEILEIMLVAHGGAHNDTICMAERKVHGKML